MVLTTSQLNGRTNRRLHVLYYNLIREVSPEHQASMDDHREQMGLMVADLGTMGSSFAPLIQARIDALDDIRNNRVAAVPEIQYWLDFTVPVLEKVRSQLG